MQGPGRRPARPAQPAQPARPAAPVRPAQPAQQRTAGRPPPVPGASGSTPSTVPTPGLFAGVDRSSFPSTRGFLQELARQSNVAWVAGYLQPAPNVGQRRVPGPGQTSTRGWMEHLDDLRAEGFGIMALYVGEQSPSVIQSSLSSRPSKRKGDTDAAEAAADANRANLGKGAVIYLDIEMIGNPDLIDAETLAYASAFFSGLVVRGYCPGLYIPFQMARAVAATWPGLPVSVVNGTRSFPTPFTGGAQSTPQAIDPLQRELARVFVERPAIMRSRTHSSPRSFNPDRADNRLDFPIHWQYAIDRNVTIPVLSRGGDSGWDFNTSLVRDPSFPTAEPRLVLVPGSDRVLALGSLAPTRDAAGVRTEGDGRHGELWTPQAARPAATTIPADTGSGDRIHPWSRPSVAEPVATSTTVSVISTDARPAEISWAVAQDTRWTRAPTLAGANAPAVRALSGVRLLRFGAELLWFGIGRDGQDEGRVLASRRVTATDWEPVAGIGGTDFRIHPTSDLACGQRNGDVVDVFVLDVDGRLHTLWRSRVDHTFPDQNSRQIGGTRVALHPQTSITIVESRVSIDVFVVGMDGLLYTTGWSDRHDWTDLRTIGSGTFRPLTPASVAAIVRGDPVHSTDVFIVDISCRLATTWRPSGGDWTAGNTQNIGGTQLYPHPATDIVAVSTAVDRIAVTVVAHNGGPVRTTWGATTTRGPPNWSDLTPVNLPAFVSPPAPSTTTP